MTTSLKDVSTAIMIGQLADLNAFEREYDVWGYGWLGEDGVHYALSDDLMSLRNMRDEQQIEGAALSPLVKHVERDIVRSEELDDWMYVRKLRLASSIRASYPPRFFEMLARLIEASCDNAAVGMLSQWKEELTGYFNEVSLNLYEGVLRQARMRRHLDAQHYRALSAWLRKERRQVFGRPRDTGAHAKTFYAVTYKENDALKFFVNANADAFFNRYDELALDDTWMSPVYVRTLYHDKAAAAAAWRQEFLDHVRGCMDDAYLERVAQLNALPSAVDAELWERSCEEARQNGPASAYEALVDWGVRLGCAR